MVASAVDLSPSFEGVLGRNRALVRPMECDMLGYHHNSYGVEREGETRLDETLLG